MRGLSNDPVGGGVECRLTIEILEFIHKFHPGPNNTNMTKGGVDLGICRE